MVSARLATLGRLLEQKQRAEAILRRIDQDIERFLSADADVEGLLVEATSRVGRQVFKGVRLQPRVERVGAPVQSRSLFQRFVRPVLEAIGAALITGSGTFTAEELRDAEYRVWFNTETGYFAEIRMRPTDPPVYKAITREEADLLRSDTPPTSLIARLFTPEEPVDH